MPHYDRTGPSGEGSMTGHGGGFCVAPVSMGLSSRGAGRGLAPYGGGRGQCFGGGRGRMRPSHVGVSKTPGWNALIAENRRLKARLEDLESSGE